LYPPSNVSAFGWSFGLFAVSPLEALDASGGINQFLLSGKERVTGRAHFQPDIGLGGAGFKFVTASAGYQHFVIFGMNRFFHFNLVFRAHSNWSHTKQNLKYTTCLDFSLPQFPSREIFLQLIAAAQRTTQ
jgi:hypothetical protein